MTHTPRLKLGLSICLMPRDPDRALFNGRPLLYAEESMLQWLMSKKHDLVMLPFLPGASDEEVLAHAANQAELIDALVLHGGSDVAPESYGQQPMRPEWAGDRPRDRHDIALVRACMERDVPILGVCRGHQVINVALGGTMLQDIGTQRPGSLSHRDGVAYQRNYHGVTLVKGSAIADLYDAPAHARVNSVHHQAIDALAEGLTVEARSSEDDIIEAVRWTQDERFVLGVQWHPEFQTGEDPDDLLDADVLLDALLAAARERLQG